MLIILEQVLSFIGRNFTISFINIDRAVVSCMHNPSNTPDTANCVRNQGLQEGSWKAYTWEAQCYNKYLNIYLEETYYTKFNDLYAQ